VSNAVALLHEVSDRRYLSEGFMAILNRPSQSCKEVAQPALVAS
jgi:putative transposase